MKGWNSSRELKAFSTKLQLALKPEATLLIDFERDTEKKLTKKNKEYFDFNLDWFPRSSSSKFLVDELGTWRWSFNIPKSNRYDLIFGNFPFESGRGRDSSKNHSQRI